jgi:mono/diheme cytochrome c family protein
MKDRATLLSFLGVLTLAFLPIALGPFAHGEDGGAPPSPDPGDATFAWVRDAILIPKCAECHRHSAGGDYRKLMDALDWAGAKWVVPGDPDASVLYIRLAKLEGRARMPLGGDRLPQRELDAVFNWIKNGAVER